MTAEIHVEQSSLFSDPISRLFTLKDQLKEDHAMRRDMEKDYPAELLELLEKLKEFKDQISAEKADFKLKLATDPEYIKLNDRIDELEHDVQKELQEFREVVQDHVSAGNQLDITVLVNGEPFRLQTQEALEIFLNGKEVK